VTADRPSGRSVISPVSLAARPDHSGFPGLGIAGGVARTQPAARPPKRGMVTGRSFPGWLAADALVEFADDLANTVECFGVVTLAAESGEADTAYCVL
jgi:hypothetical protein